MIRFAIFLLLLANISFAQIWRGLLMDTIPEWKDSARIWEPNLYESETEDSLTLETSGYKSIRLVTGDQGTDIQQEMRLGIQGEVAPGWFVDGRLVDEGVQAGELRVTTLQQVDEMYLRLQHGDGMIAVGNLRYVQESLSLFGTDHQTLGGILQHKGSKAGGQWAFGHDPVRKLTSVFPGRDGQRNGYLIGESGGSFVAVVPGSEKVYLNGVLLQAGVDYKLDAVGGVLDFLTVLPGERDQVRVEYEAYADSYSNGFLAADAQWNGGHFQFNWASVGEWADLKEVRKRITRSDSTDSTEVPLEDPEDIRLLGVRGRMGLESFGILSLEGAYSRYDANSLEDSIPVVEGGAGRWRFVRNENWLQLQKGMQWDILGNIRSENFQVRNHQGKTNDWEAWELRENWELDSLDSVPGKRFHQQFRLGFSPDGQWRPWLGAGWRQGNPTFWSKRLESGLDHATRSVVSHVRIAGVEADQKGSKQRLVGEMNSESREGILRPFGSGYAAWRNLDPDSAENREYQDLRSASGVRYGRRSEGYEGSLEWSGQGLRRKEPNGSWIDSLNSVGVLHRLDAGNTDFGLNSLLQWKQIWEEVGTRTSWISEQQGHWSLLAQEGHVSHRLGLTREHPLTPDYRKVADGTGDVVYDSLLQEWVEGVDRGNWVRDGWIREDSLPMVEQSEVALKLEEWISPGLLFQVEQGLLRDIRIGFRGEWSRKDTAHFEAIPPFRWVDMKSSLEGMSLQEGLLQWEYPGQIAWAEFRSGRALERRWSAQRSEEQRWWQGTTWILRLPETWEWEASYDQEEVQILAPTQMQWQTQDLQPTIRKELPLDWHVEVYAHFRSSEGSSEWGALNGKLLQPGFGVWKVLPNGEMRLNYSYTRVEMDNAEMPLRIMNGYPSGWTHRAESRLTYHYRDRLSLEFSYLWRLEEKDDRPFQKISGEAKAYF